MLPRKHRLRLQSGQKLDGKTFSGRLLVLIAQPSSTPTSQAAVVISKKVARLAVQRNRIKRQVSHALYPLLQSLPPTQLLFIAKKPSVGATYADIQREVVYLAGKVYSS